MTLEHETQPKNKIWKIIGEALCWVIFFPVTIMVTFVAYPMIAVLIALGFFAFAVLIFLKMISIPKFTTWRPLGLVATAVMTLNLTLTHISEEKLKKTAPQEYLAKLKVSDEKRWFSELEQLDPEGYRVEKERRDAAEKAAEAERIREVEADREAQIAALLEAEYGTFSTDLKKAHEEISEFSLSGTASLDDILSKLRKIDSYVEILARGQEVDPTEEETQMLKEIRDQLSTAQSTGFPNLRVTYANNLKRLLWVGDTYVSTGGKRSDTITLKNTKYILNANIAEDYDLLVTQLKRLRFKKAIFRSGAGGKYTYYDLPPPLSPTDKELVYWEGPIPTRLQSYLGGE